MASVRITQGIVYETTAKANRMATTAHPSPPPLPDTWVTDMLRAMIAAQALTTDEEKAAWGRVPRDWLPQVQTFEVHRIGDYTVERTIDREFRSAVRIPTPAHLTAVDYREPKGVLSCADPSLQPYADTLRDHVELKIAREKARADFVASVQKIMGSTTTIKAALAIWPGLRGVLPSSVLQAHEARGPARASSSKPASAPETPALDTAALDAAVVKAKLLQR